MEHVHIGGTAVWSIITTCPRTVPGEADITHHFSFVQEDGEPTGRRRLQSQDFHVNKIISTSLFQQFQIRIGEPVIFNSA